MAARPDLVKSMYANSYQYELHSDNPFVPPIDYPVGELWLKSRHRPPSPPTDYFWDKPYPFVSYGGQQNFHSIEKRKPDPPVDYLDLEPVPVKPFQTPPPIENGSQRYKDIPVSPQNNQQYHKEWIQHNNRIRSGYNCADCPICNAMAAATGALVPATSEHQLPRQPKSQYQTPISPIHRPYGGVPVFPVNRNLQRSYKPYNELQRTISFEDEYQPHNRISLAEDFEDNDHVNGVPYQKERRQLAYMDDMVSRGAFMVKVMVDRVARSPQELTISRGEVLEVLNDQKSWWKCCNVTGQVGYAPFNLLKQMRKNEITPTPGYQIPVPDYAGRRRR